MSMRSFLTSISLLLVVGASRAFSPVHRRSCRPLQLPLHRSGDENGGEGVGTTTTALHGTKRRGGGLANNISTDEDGNVRVITNKQKQRRASKTKRDDKRGRRDDKGGAAISPLLAEWAKEDDSSSSSSMPSPSSGGSDVYTKDDSSYTSSNVFVPFDDDDGDEGFGGSKKGKKKRKLGSKSKQARAVLSAAQSSQIDELLERISDTLATTNCDVPELVSDIRSLVELGSSFSKDQVLLPTLKSILSARPVGKEEKQPSYRLAWAGSDDAICHVGTSLHKVPLARLQEIYLLLGFGRWELLEVIRILGPFPNVRNTLKGDLKAKKLSAGGGVDGGEREGVRMEIAYNSMIDGTGKEILAGKEDNVKRVDLNVWFASEKAIVCTVPSSSDDNENEGSEDPLGGNGSKILFFVTEENLDEELEKLRAA